MLMRRSRIYYYWILTFLKNGHEVLQFIKADTNLKHIPVIMLTTSSSETDIVATYRNYANCYISKPVEVDSFLDIISKIETSWISIVTLPSKTIAR